MDILIGKTGETVAVDVDKLSDSTKDFLFNYGVKQWLNDKHASVQIGKEGATAETVTAVVNDALAALYAGNIRRSGGGRTSDPVAKEMRAIATQRANKIVRDLPDDRLRTKLADHGWDFAKDTKAKARSAFVAAIVEQLLEKREAELRETAKANLAKANALDVGDLDI